MNMGAARARHSYSADSEITKHQLAPGTLRRIAAFARPYLKQIVLFLAFTIVDASLAVLTPLLFKSIIDDGVLKQDSVLVAWLALAIGLLAFVQGGLTLIERWYSARITGPRVSMP